MTDLCIKNGYLIDTKGKIFKPADIKITNGVISDIGDFGDFDARYTIDAGGCIVTSGLTDFHCHYDYGGNDFGIVPEVTHIPYGVTTVVDGGSTGCANFEIFKRNVMENSLLNTKAFLLCSSSGQIGHGCNENMDPKSFNENRILSLCEKYKDKIVGLKIRQSKNIVGEYGLEPLKRAIEIAEKAGLRVSVHVPDSPGEVKETLDLLRAGDVFCHAYHMKGKTILDENGKVLPEVIEARRRGVLFESANGNTNFSVRVAQKAFEDNFYPDIISTDSAIASSTGQVSMNIMEIFTIMLNLGMKIEDIIKAATETPASLCGINDSGLSVGNRADIAVLKIKDGHKKITDFYGDELECNRIISCEATIKDGLIMYEKNVFN